MILWTLLYLSFALALPTPSDLPPDIPPSVFIRNADIFGTRSIWGIIWSCLSTIFACTWVAIHPNIPGPRDSQWAVLRRRVATMGYTLIAPEIVIGWATRQHLAARYTAKRYQGRGWTMAHGFFLGMGGFTLHDQKGTALRILALDEFEKLSKTGKIAWPSITEEEIQDRSKGDYLSKGIVLIQTSWFITQCIVRGVYGLAITELEVATLALATLSGITYYLWWHKPLDVRCSVPVYLREDKVQVASQSESPICEGQILPTPLAIAPDPGANVQELHTSNSILAPPRNNSTTTPGLNLTRIQQFSAFIQRQQQKHGTLLGLFYAFIFYPLLIFFLAFIEMLTSDNLDQSVLRVPTFYAPDVSDDSLTAFVATCVAVVFGGIHCIAWSFHFPSPQERLAWRISAVSVSGLPILILAGLYSASVVEKNVFQLILTVTLIALYVVARILLIVLPLIALRALPPAAFIEVQWTSFFPHIG